MEFFKKLYKTVMYPHKAILIPLVPVSVALLVVCSLFFGSESVPAIVSYVVAAYTLTAVCLRIPDIIDFVKAFRQNNKLVYRYTSDSRFRMNVNMYVSLIINIGYAVLQLGLGIYHVAAWYLSFAIYYAMLAVMKYYLLGYIKKHEPGEDMRTEIRRYRFCAVTLAFMHLVLAVIVALIILVGRTFVHHEITVIALAAYTFTSFTMAIVGIVKHRGYDTPAYSASRAVGLCSAIVSILTLQTAMLTAFSTEADAVFRRIISIATGSAVILSVLAIAVYMLVRSFKFKYTQNSQKDIVNG